MASKGPPDIENMYVGTPPVENTRTKSNDVAMATHFGVNATPALSP
jgi:hypothetical protein